MNKKVLNFVFYILYFLTTSYAIWLIWNVNMIVFLILNKLHIIDDYDAAFYTILFTALYRLLSPLVVSILLIKKCQNPLILKFYNNISTPVKILLSLIALDSVIFLIKGLVTNVWDFSEYIIVYSGTLTFIPILLSAIWNIISQKRNAQ